MDDESLTRRRLLAASAGVVSAASLSGCSGLLGEGDDESGDGEGSADGALDAVPAESAEVLVSVDVDRILNDDLLRERFETLAGSGPGNTVGAPPSVDESLEMASSTLGVDPRDISSLLAFGELGEGTDDASQGVVVDADWTEDDIENALVSEGFYEASSYSGQTVYEGDADAVGVVADGQYVVGPPDVIRESIDTAVGDGPSLDNDAAAAFRDAPDGYVRMGFAPSSGTTAFAEDDGVDAVADLQRGTGALYRDADSRGGELTMEFGSDATAEQVTTLLDDGRERFRDELGGEQFSEFGEQFSTVVAETSVSRDGTDVVVENDDGNGWLLLIPVAVVGSFVLGLGQRTTTPAPQVSFDFEWDADAEELTITHAAGDAIRADRLFVRGGSLDSSWRDLGGRGSSTVGGAPAITAGDSVTVEVSPGTTLRLLWQSPADSSQRVLGRFDVPDR